MDELLSRIRADGPTQIRIAELIGLPSVANPISDDMNSLDHLRLLIDDYQTRRGVVPFVGAGLSIPFGASSWPDFLSRNAADADLQNDVQVLLQQNTPDYERAASILLAAKGKGIFQTAMELAFLHKLERKRQCVQAMDLLPHLPSGPVVTTNFDRALESIYRLSGEAFEQVLWGARAEDFNHALNRGTRVLLKIHGDLRDSRDRVLTEEEYKQHYGSLEAGSIEKTMPLPHTLHNLFRGQPLLFLGCSLAADRTQQLLALAAGEYGAILHYAVMKRLESSDDQRNLERKLWAKNIRPIWIARHEDLPNLLAYIIAQTKSTSSLGGLFGALRSDSYEAAMTIGRRLLVNEALPEAARFGMALISVRHAHAALKAGEWDQGLADIQVAQNYQSKSPLVSLLVCLLNIGKGNYGLALSTLDFAENPSTAQAVNPDADLDTTPFNDHLVDMLGEEWQNYEELMRQTVFLLFLLTHKYDEVLRLAHQPAFDFAFGLDLRQVKSVVGIAAQVAKGEQELALQAAKAYLSSGDDSPFRAPIEYYVRRAERPAPQGFWQWTVRLASDVAHVLSNSHLLAGSEKLIRSNILVVFGVPGGIASRPYRQAAAAGVRQIAVDDGKGRPALEAE